MELRYGLEDRPPAGETALLALQWLAVSLPFVVIVGTVAAGDGGTVYLQKAAFVSALMLLGQYFLGHRLTLVAGPSTALLLGILGSRHSPDAAYTAAAACGLLLAALSAAGLFGALRGMFTSRVVSAVLLLIALTMAPSIGRLLAGGEGGTAGGRLGFSALFVLALFAAHRFSPPGLRSFLVVAGMAAGSAAWLGIFGAGGGRPALPAFASFFSGFPRPVPDPGAMLSFLFCHLALALNEIGSIQAVTPLLRPEGMDGRIRRGMTVAGAVSAVSGFLGVIGPVDYSLSPGIIAAGGCGARRPLLLTTAMLLAASLSPAVLGVAAAIPRPVIGGLLVYAMSIQMAAGLKAAYDGGRFDFDDALVIGCPVLAGTVVSLLPPEATAAVPALLRPVAGNGFVVGVVLVLALERLYGRTRG
jgi:xanthine/uracil permease